MTAYTKVSINYGTIDQGRGNRGVDIDFKEFLALKSMAEIYSKEIMGPSHRSSSEDFTDDTNENPEIHLKPVLQISSAKTVPPRLTGDKAFSPGLGDQSSNRSTMRQLVFREVAKLPSGINRIERVLDWPTRI